MCSFLKLKTICLGDDFMKFFYTIIWLFPILFMFQDFEEIIMINVWKKRNKHYILRLKEKNRYVPYPFDGSTASFSVAVLIEFIIIFLVCIFSCIFNNYIVWMGLFIGFIVHLFAHIWLNIKFCKYVPGTITSVILIPICIYLLYKSNILALFSVRDIILSIVSACLIILIEVYTLHKLINKFDLWLEKYALMN